MKVLLIHSGNAVNGDSSRYSFVKEQGLKIESLGNEVSYFSVVGKGIKGYLRNVKLLKCKIKEINPNIIHAHYGLCGIVALLSTSKIPVVITFHNGETLNWKINLLCSLFVKKAKYVFYVAQHIYDKCFIKAKHYSILPCGITMEDMVITDYSKARKLLGWTENKKYILFGGSISNKRKNYSFLEKSLKIIQRKDIEVIEMKGFSRGECVLRMCACDCFCLPSLSEGSPQALKEAMACNCPAVATDIADVRTLFGDEGGYYISNFDAYQLAGCIEKCLKFEGRTKGRNRIIKLGLGNEQVASIIVETYKKILNDE